MDQANRRLDEPERLLKGEGQTWQLRSSTILSTGALAPRKRVPSLTK
jgi:hypothetical protein